MSRERYLTGLYIDMFDSNISDEFASPISRALAMGRDKIEPEKIQAFLDNDLITAIKIYKEHSQVEELVRLVEWAVQSGIDLPVKAEGTYTCGVFLKLIDLAKAVSRKRSRQDVLKDILDLIGHKPYEVGKSLNTLDSHESALFIRLFKGAFLLESPQEDRFVALIIGAPLCLIMRGDYHNINDKIEIMVVDDRESGLEVLSKQKGWSIKSRGSVGLSAATRVRAAIEDGV